MKRQELTIPIDAFPLAGEWNCRLDITDQGIANGWYETDLGGRVILPGTTDSNHLGLPGGENPSWQLSRRWEYTGPAWYQRTFFMPQPWCQRRVFLFLERVNWESQVWVSAGEQAAHYVGRQNSLAAPHLYELTGLLQEGHNRITIRVNNAKYAYPRSGEALPDLLLGSGGAHNDAATQTNWNGIVGRIEMRACDPIGIDAVQVFPDVVSKKARIQLDVANTTGVAAEVDLYIQVREKSETFHSPASAAKVLVFQTRLRAGAEGKTRAMYEIEMGEDVRLWDEAHPFLYRADISLSCLNRDQIYADSKTAVFGMRELAQSGTQIAVNGRTMFLRGTVNNAQFPLSAYAPMEKSSWLKIFETARRYGLNMMRFRSWCPPEVAFAAADELGFWLQVELPATPRSNRPEPPSLAQFLRAELERILAAYGNHPSFLGLSMGHELLAEGDENFLARQRAALAERVRLAREIDPRHLYTSSSHPYTPGRPDDFFISAWGEARAQSLTGMEWGSGEVACASRFNILEPETGSDYRAGLEGIDKPVLSHEVGQWVVFPNLAEIPKFNGLLRPGNLERLRGMLEEKGLLEQADDFVLASGRLSQILYREELEAALRTPGLGGFQLHGLQDQQGPGVSTVGLLDVFGDGKGLVPPDVFRRSCADSVLLLRMARRVFTLADSFQARVEIAHYGANPLADVRPAWAIADADGRVLGFGDLPARTVPAGGLSSLGEISFGLENVEAPARLTVSVYLAGMGLQNEWDIWVYPERLEDPQVNRVLVAEEWTPSVREILYSGGRVLLLPRGEDLPGSIPGSFTPAHGNALVRSGQAEKTLGWLCEPSHPALAQFPTEFHSNWQWWDLAVHSRVMILDEVPASFRPIVQVIDSAGMNRKLGVMFQARVGKGRLLVSSIDLANDLGQRPVARQLRYSLLNYMNGDSFYPQHELSLEVIDGLFGRQEERASTKA